MRDLLLDTQDAADNAWWAMVRGFGEFQNPAFRHHFWMSVIIGILLTAGIWLYADLEAASWPVLGHGPVWEIIVWAVKVGWWLYLAFCLFPLMLNSTTFCIIDDIQDAVEERHYPGNRASRRYGILEIIVLTFRYIGIGLVAGVFGILLTLTIPVAGLAIHLTIQGYILGRLHFDFVALRHFDTAATNDLRWRNFLKVLVCGMAIAVLWLLPLINIIAPLIGHAAMTHLFHRILREEF